VCLASTFIFPAFKHIHYITFFFNNNSIPFLYKVSKRNNTITTLVKHDMKEETKNQHGSEDADNIVSFVQGTNKVTVNPDIAIDFQTRNPGSWFLFRQINTILTLNLT